MTPASRPADTQQDPAGATQLDAALLQSWPLPVDDGSDKYSRGTVLVVGGSSMTPGAVLLAGRAALRMGAGRLQVATAPEVAIPVGVAFPEAMVMPWRAAPDGLLRESIAEADAVVVGPGLLGDEVAAVVDAVLRDVHRGCVVVLDAAAIMVFDRLDPATVDRVRAGLLMTPNREEARSLVTDAPAGDASVLAAAACATGAVLTSFGWVYAPDGRRWQADDDVVGLGTSGSGDVLAGLAAGAAARCGDRSQAACWATFAHFAAARRLEARLGTLGYVASDILAEVPACLPR